MRGILLMCFLLLAGCGAKAAPGVDPCTGIKPVAGKSDNNAWIRTGHWLEHPNLSKDQACAAGNAELDGYRKQDTEAAATQAANPTPQRRSLTNGQIDRMTTFATIIGRANGCGFTTSTQTRNLVTWLTQNVSDPTAREAYLETASIAADLAAAQQRSGATGDSCLDVSAGLKGAVLR